jgi:hypothetical protein
VQSIGFAVQALTTFVEMILWFMYISDNTKDVKNLITETC